MRRKTILFILLSVIIAGAPVTNWHVDADLIKGVIWRITMLMTFGIGYWWNYLPKRKKKVNNILTYWVE